MLLICCTLLLHHARIHTRVEEMHCLIPKIKGTILFCSMHFVFIHSSIHSSNNHKPCTSLIHSMSSRFRNSLQNTSNGRTSTLVLLSAIHGVFLSVPLSGALSSCPPLDPTFPIPRARNYSGTPATSKSCQPLPTTHCQFCRFSTLPLSRSLPWDWTAPTTSKHSGTLSRT